MANDSVGLFGKTLQLIAPQPCYDEFFVKFNLFHAQCLKIALSKCLGYSIILGAVMVKVPQILKIFKAKSAEGINLLAILCELFAISATTVYGYILAYPFSSYGEGVFLCIQTSMIGFLVLFYSNRSVAALLFLSIYGAIMAYLLSGAAPMTLLSLLQSSNIPIVILSKMIQAVTNFRNSSTGQLSAVTVFLLFAGSVARIFTSIQETGDTLIVITYITSTFSNGIIASQILYYWNSKPKPKSE